MKRRNVKVAAVAVVAAAAAVVLAAAGAVAVAAAVVAAAGKRLATQRSNHFDVQDPGVAIPRGFVFSGG